MDSLSELVRIQTVEWAKVTKKPDTSHTAKVREFLAMIAKVYSRLGVRASHPFRDPCALLGCPFEFKCDIPMNEIMAEIPLVRIILESYYMTLKLIELKVENARDVGEAFKPIVISIEDGCILDMHRGELIIDDQWAIPLHNWIERYSHQSVERHS